MKFKYVVVGAGLSGSTIAERIASQLDEKVLVIEKRKQLAGNCYDFYNEHGVLVHKYGPHLFHTKLKAVWDYLSKFTEWRLYQPRVLSYVDGKLVPIPINLDTVNELLGSNLDMRELLEFHKGLAQPIKEIKNSRDVVLSKVGEYFYEKMYKHYTEKAWGVPPDKLGPEVCARLLVRLSRDDRYFDDPYQGIPKEGYTRMIEKMLSHPNIELILGVDCKEVINWVEYERLFYTGPLDYFFDYEFGKLPYRTLNIKFETYDRPYYQSAVAILYPNDYDFTRICEFKYMTGQECRNTTISKEFPKDATAEEEPYYPMCTRRANALADKYRQRTQLERSVRFLGRLAEYKYYNMDIVVSRALERFRNTKNFALRR